MNEVNPIIGFIMMGGSAALETQIHRELPESVEMSTTRVPFHNVSYKGLLEMIERIPDAARVLAEARPNVIAVTSLTGSCIRGKEMVNIIEQATGVPAIVPGAEFVRALGQMGAKRIALITAFDTELVMLERLFFTESGIEIAKIIEVEHASSDDPFPVSIINYDKILEKLSTSKFSEIDAVLVDMPTFKLTPEICAVMEQRHGDKPVLTMLQILLWSTLKKVGCSTEHLYISKFLKP